MARYYLVKLGTLYLTDDETAIGQECKTEVTGPDSLFSAYAGITSVPISGSPFNFIRENEGAGAELEIKPFVLTPTQLDDLKTLFDGADLSGNSFQAVFTGDTGTFDVQVKPFHRPNLPAVKFGRFLNGRIYDSVLSIIVESIN